MEIMSDYDPDRHPIVGPLLAGGPAELVAGVLWLGQQGAGGQGWIRTTDTGISAACIAPYDHTFQSLSGASVA